MPDERKRQSLPPERLREVLDRLNDVLAEAARVRDDINRQLDEQHLDSRQHLSTGPRKRKRRK